MRAPLTERQTTQMLLQVSGNQSVKHDPEQLPSKLKKKLYLDLLQSKPGLSKKDAVKAMTVTQKYGFKDHNEPGKVIIL